MALDRSPALFAHRFYVLVLFFRLFVIPVCGRLTWPAIWSTFGRAIKFFDWLVDWVYFAVTATYSVKTHDGNYTHGYAKKVKTNIE